jgi:hypothetical protein
MTDDDQSREAQERDLMRVTAALKPRLERAEKAYGQALTSLWAGNGAAALATLSFIAATWKDGGFPRWALLPPSFFVLGVILMGIGAMATVWREARAIHRMQWATSILDMPVSVVETPAQRVGLTLDVRAVCAILSGFSFIAGCIAGLALIAFRAA